VFDFNELKKLIVPAQFGSDEYNEVTDSMQTVFEQLPLSVQTVWGATQFVIIDGANDKVAKIPFTGEFWEDDNEAIRFTPYRINYCDFTYKLYRQALDYDIIDIFAETEYFGTTANDVIILLQEKVIDYYDRKDCSPSTISEDSKNKYKSLKGERSSAWQMFPEDWVTAAIEWYGIDVVRNFFWFCDNNCLDDFHTGNIGWRKDGSPCVLDWAGFNE